LLAVVVLIAKALVGGAMVVAFSLVGEVIEPRRLGGITSGAPSVALPGLLVTLLASGAAAAVDLSLGMIAGAAALVVWCLVGIDAVKRFGALKGSVAAMSVWFVVAISLWALLLR